MPLKKRTGPSTEELELARVLQLPARGMMELEDLEIFSFENMLASAYDAGERFKLQQATAMRDYVELGGGFLPLAVGKGKCTCGSSEFNDLRTGRRSVAEEGPVAVDSMDEHTGRFAPRQASAFPSGRKQCVRLSLKGGQQIDLSTDHPIFTHRGWLEASGVKHDDLIAAPRRLLEPAKPVEVDDTDVKMLAYLLADGGLTHHPTFTDDLPETLQEVSSLARSLGWKVSEYSKQNNRATDLNLSNGVLPWVRRWGINTKSKDKRLPACLYNMPSRQCALFLNRFWACDGHVAPTHLECTLASHGLIRDLRYLLLRLGVLCRVRFAKARCNGKQFDAWRLTVHATEAEKLLEKMGIPPGQDSRVEEFLIKRQGIKHNPNTDVVPIGMPEFKEICDEIGIQGVGGCWRQRAVSSLPSRGELKKFLGVTDGQWISRSKWESFVEKYAYSGRYAWLAFSDLSWERIESIVPIGKQPVYDLSVDTTHNFIANGIVVHNTGVALFAVNHAYAIGIRKSLLLVPSQLVSSLILRHIPWWRKRINLTVPFHFLAGRSVQARKAIANSNAPGCYVMPYSLASKVDTVEVLDKIAPELLVADEVHHLKKSRTARTKKIMSYVRKHGPQFVCMSGTITQKSLMDYHHLISAALGDDSPLPRMNSMAASWDNVVNAMAEKPDSGGTRLMRPLLSWARDNTDEKFDERETESYRRAFRHRLTTAPGVVASAEDDLGVSILFRNTPVEDHEKCERWDDLKELMEKVEDNETPQGEVIAHAFHRHKWMLELAGGFYNLLEWPTPESLMKSRHISSADAGGALEGAKLHHQAQQVHYSWLRKYFKTSPPDLSTPREVGLALAIAEKKERRNRRIPAPVTDSWHDMKALQHACIERFEFMPKRRSRPVRVCDYKIRHAVEWAKEHERGIMWVWHQEMGVWLVEALAEAGLDPLYCPAGEKHNQAIEEIGDPEFGGKGDRIVVASISAHGTGKNLQAFDRAFFVQWPRSGKDGEQTVGRIHRYGQRADAVEIGTNLTIEFDHQVRAACLNDSLYVAQTTGAAQRVVFGDYDPLPQIYSAAFLREQGIENVQDLDATGRRIRTENFGSICR